jgi:4'-phosphopantetheinyl transferase
LRSERSFAEDCRSIASDEVHVWVETVDGGKGLELAASDAALLDDEERRRLEQLVRMEDRVLFGQAHSGLRRTLAHYAGVDPASWKFGRNRHGRPEIREPSFAASLQFNLTHTRGLFAIVVAIDREIGIDAEHLDRATNVEDIAEHTFSPGEVERLRAQPSEEARRALFFEYWTLKEAYLKACGTGIASALDTFWFTSSSPIRIQFAGASHTPFEGNGSQDPSSSWQFDLLAPTPRTRLAVAMRRRPGEAPLKVRWANLPGH